MSRPILTTVSELHLCRRCPRLLALTRSGKEKTAWKVGLTGGSFCGKIFHDSIMAPFYRDVSGEGTREKRQDILERLEKSGADFAAMKHELIRFADKNYYTPYLAENAQKLVNAQIESLYRYMDIWLDFLVDFFRRSPGYKDDPALFAQRAFMPSEKLMESSWTALDGSVLTVRGRFDCALLDCRGGEILLAEFKCRKESDPTEELAQLALYAWLIRQTTGIMPRGAVLYFEEENPTVFFTQQEMNDAVKLLPFLFETALQSIQNAKQPGAVIPKSDTTELCIACPFAGGICDKYAVPASELPFDTEADGRMSQLVETLGKFKLSVTPSGHVSGPRFIRLKIAPSPEKGVTVAKIQNRVKDLQVNMGLTAPPLIQAQSGHVSVDIPRQSPKPLTLMPLIRSGKSNRPSSESAVPVPVGAEIDGQTFWIDLADPTTTSILIGGTSGSGKSVLLQSLILGLFLANPTLKMETTLIDPKRVTFTKFPLEKCAGELICDQRPALDRLKMLVEEMEQRYHLLEENRCYDIAEYNRNENEQLARHVVVIDEFADLMVEKKMNKELEHLIQRIGQKGRAAGFHLILATQRPEAKVISPLIKANLQLKIAMKVTSQANSNIILDTPGAECLIGNGDMLLGGSVSLRRLQGAWASQTDYETLKKRK